MNSAVTQNPHRVRPAARQNIARIILAVIATLFALLLGLIVILLIGTETGLVGLMIGLVCATLPVPIYIILLLWIDRYESEPLWMLATAFFWGALVAVFAALILNTLVGGISGAVANSKEFGDTVGAVVSAPIVEESAKALILLVFFFWKKDEFDGVVDGIVYAGMVGLGFAMTENILYYGRAAEKGSEFLTFVLVLRGMAAPFAHPLFTSMTGIGLGWARQSQNGFVKIAMPFLGFLLAMLMHALWNGSAAFGGGVGFFVVYFIVMGPAFIITLMVTFFALRHEGRIVRQFLYSDYQQGLFDAHEYEKLCTVRGRMGMSWTAFWSYGFSNWRTRKRCNQIASELAFHRSRVARGLGRHPQDASDRESDYIYTLQLLRQQLAQQHQARR